MKDLIDRIEKAIGPDRELDAQIAIAINAIPSEASRPCAAVDVGTFAVGSYGYWTAPAYTASIDAAVTLISSGFTFYVDSGTNNSGDHCHACVWKPGDHWSAGGCKEAATPAIALSVAALRSISTSNQTEQK